MGRGKLVPDGVMIGDDHVQANSIGEGDLLHGANPAVHGDDQGHAVLAQPAQRLLVQTITFVHAIRDVGRHLATQRFQRLGEQRGAGDAVRVKIAVDRDLFAALDGGPDAGDGLRHPAHEERIVQRVVAAVEKYLRFVERILAAIVQDLRHDRVVGPQLCQDVRRNPGG